MRSTPPGTSPSPRTTVPLCNPVTEPSSTCPDGPTSPSWRWARGEGEDPRAAACCRGDRFEYRGESKVSSCHRARKIVTTVSSGREAPGVDSPAMSELRGVDWRCRGGCTRKRRRSASRAVMWTTSALPPLPPLPAAPVAAAPPEPLLPAAWGAPAFAGSLSKESSTKSFRLRRM
jgi:hypothetical protein